MEFAPGSSAYRFVAGEYLLSDGQSFTPLEFLRLAGNPTAPDVRRRMRFPIKPDETFVASYS